MRMKRFKCVVLIGLLLFGWCGKVKASPVDSLRLFAEALEEHAAALDEHFTISCTPFIINELKKPSKYDKDSTILSELQSQAGMTGFCKLTWYDDKVEFTENAYYAGWRILRSYINKQTNQLSSQEQLTLERALEIVGTVSGSDLNKERYIYDTLCQKITYETDDSTANGDKDCAIGALVNGKADCDGYADAMVLCCGLAGIQCRYMHGKSLKPSVNGSNDGSHMWNLVNIKKQWLMTDVTWGDQETRISYLYFNLGKNDTQNLYQWDSECVFTNIAEETDFSASWMPDQEPVVIQTIGDVYNVARQAANSGRVWLMLYCPEEVLWERYPEAFATMLHSGAITTYTYAYEGRLCELTNIIIPQNFCFCDSENDIVSAIQRYAENKTSSFALYINPSITTALFANQHARLQKILSQSCLQDGYRYSYGEDTGAIEFADVSFVEPLPYCSSEEEVISLIRKDIVSQPVKITMLLDDGLSVEQIIEKAADAVYACGAKSMSYLISGNRLSLIINSYYDSYCLANTEDEVLSYLETAKKEGQKEIRVYCSEMLYVELKQNNADRFFSLLKQAGYEEDSFSYNDSNCLLIVER